MQAYKNVCIRPISNFSNTRLFQRMFEKFAVIGYRIATNKSQTYKKFGLQKVQNVKIIEVQSHNALTYSYMQALFILKIPDEMKETYIQNVMKYIDLLEF